VPGAPCAAAIALAAARAEPGAEPGRALPDPRAEGEGERALCWRALCWRALRCEGVGDPPPRAEGEGERALLPPVGVQLPPPTTEPRRRAERAPHSLAAAAEAATLRALSGAAACEDGAPRRPGEGCAGRPAGPASSAYPWLLAIVLGLATALPRRASKPLAGPTPAPRAEGEGERALLRAEGEGERPAPMHPRRALPRALRSEYCCTSCSWRRRAEMVRCEAAASASCSARRAFACAIAQRFAMFA